MRLSLARKIVVHKVAFESPEDRGVKVRASYLSEPNGEALIEIFRDGEKRRWFLFPAHKIHHIHAHFLNIVESELRGDRIGYDISDWTGFVTR